MTNEQRYEALQTELQAVERRTGLYLADKNIDRENVDRSLEEGSEEQFANLIACASMAAGMRAEEAGADLTALLGRAIY